MSFVFPLTAIPREGERAVTYPDNVPDPIANNSWYENFLAEAGLTSENVARHLHFTLHLIARGADVVVRGNFNLEAKPECVRCLERFELPLKFDARGVYEKVSKKPVSGETQLTADDLERYEFSGDSISLDDFILDSLELALPDFPVCKPDCPGISTTNEKTHPNLQALASDEG